MRGLRSQIFRQNVQIISVHTDVWILIFGQSDGIICKQGVRHELCGIALKLRVTDFKIHRQIYQYKLNVHNLV